MIEPVISRLNLNDLNAYKLLAGRLEKYIQANGIAHYMDFLKPQQLCEAVAEARIAGLWIKQQLVSVVTVENCNIASRLAMRFDGSDIFFADCDGYYLRNVMTDPAYHGLGYGTMLLNQLAQDISDGTNQPVMLTTNMKNMPGHKVAMAAGFILAGQITRRMDQAETALFVRQPAFAQNLKSA